jgi:hypothetical protein
MKHRQVVLRFLAPADEDSAKRHHTHALIEGSGAFAMHLIDETQLDLVWRFGLQSGRDVDKFASQPFRTGITGSPLLPGVPSRDKSGRRSCSTTKASSPWRFALTVSSLL